MCKNSNFHHVSKAKRALTFSTLTHIYQGQNLFVNVGWISLILTLYLYFVTCHHVTDQILLQRTEDLVALINTALTFITRFYKRKKSCSIQLSPILFIIFYYLLFYLRIEQLKG